MYCSQCGTRHEPDANFCTRCGHRVARQPEQAATPFPQPSPQVPTAPTSPFAPPAPFEQPEASAPAEVLPLGMPTLKPQPPTVYAPQPPFASGAQPEEPFGSPSRQPYASAPPDRGPMSKQTIGLIALCLVIIVGGLIYYFSGRDGSSQSTPEKTVESFLKAFKNEDAKTLMKMVSVESLGNPDKDEMKDMIGRIEERFDSGKITNYKVLDSEVDDDTATVDYRVTIENGEDDASTERGSFEVIKVGGKWYLDNISF